jgi:hypothetical protein
VDIEHRRAAQDEIGLFPPEGDADETLAGEDFLTEGAGGRTRGKRHGLQLPADSVPVKETWIPGGRCADS